MTLTSYYSSKTVTKCPFCGLFSAIFFVPFVGGFTMYDGPNHCADVLCRVPKHKKAVMCFAEKIHVLDKVCSCMSCLTVAPEFNVNESSQRNTNIA